MKNYEDIPACSPGSEFAQWNPLSSSQHRKAPLLQPSQWYLLGCFSAVWWGWGLWALPQTWPSEIIRQAEGSLDLKAHNSHPPSAQYSLTVHLRCFRSSPLALTLYQRYSHLPRACAQGVQLSKSLQPPPSCLSQPLCEQITNTSPWHVEEPSLMHLNGAASDLVSHLWPTCEYHAIYFLLLSNGSIKHFKGTLNLWNNLVFIIVYMFVEAVQAERAWGSLSSALFTPQRAGFFQQQHLPSIPMQCAGAPGLQEHPGAVDQEIILAQLYQAETLPAICQKRVLGVWPLVFSSLGTGAPAVLRAGLTFPHQMGWQDDGDQ